MNVHRRSACVAVALLALAVHAPFASGAAIVQVTPTYRSWKLEGGGGPDATISQFLFPISARIPISAAVDLTVSTAAASSSWEPTSGSSPSVSGTSPLTSHVFVHLADRRVLLQGGITVPSGKRELETTDLTVLRALSLPLLGFGLRQYGRGLELNGGASVAQPIGSNVLGSIGAGFTTRGAYTFVAGEQDFHPASEWTITGGFDWGTESGGRAPLGLDVTFRSFGTDQIGDRDVVREGSQLELQARGNMGADEGMLASAVVRGVIKGHNKIFTPDTSGVLESETNSGSGVFAQLGASWPLVSQRGGLEAEWNHVSGSDTFGRDGNSFGIGPSMDLLVGSTGSIHAEALYLAGKLEGAGGDVDLKGYSISLLGRWGWGGGP